MDSSNDLLVLVLFRYFSFCVLSRPHSFNHSLLPAFYSSLLLAWRSLDGSFDDRLSSLVFASRDPHARRVVSDLSSKIGYLLLLDENYAVPHCVEKCKPTFGAIYWPSTWRQLPPLLIFTVQFWTFLGRSLMVLF